MDVTIQQIEIFLNEMDDKYPVHLSQKINLHQYALKLYEKGVVLPILKDDKIVAMVAGYIKNTTDNIAYISLVGTLPNYNGNGYATKLVKEFINLAKQEGLLGVHLYTTKENDIAINIYTKLGFVDWLIDKELRPYDKHMILRFNKNVLVTAIGSLSADIVIKQLRNDGFFVVGTDIYLKYWVANTLNANKFYQVPTTLNSEEYLDKIKEICLIEGISYLVPLTDLEIDVLNESRNWFAEHNILLLISSKFTIDLCRNKYKTFTYMQNNLQDVQLIETKLLDDCLNEPFCYPMIAKPFDGRSSNGIVRVYNHEDWIALKSKIDSNKYIVQPLIKGHIITVDVIRSKDNVVTIMRKELLRTKNGAGLSVYVFQNDKLHKICEKLANLLKIDGCVNFEFIDKDDQGDFYFIECNPRFSGGVKFSCIAGYNCISNHIKSFIGGNIDSFKLENNYYIARKFEEFVTCKQKNDIK